MKSLKVVKTKVYCFDPSYKKYMLMGFKVGNVFFKKVESKHFMKICNGYGLQYDAFVLFQENGIEKIRIIESGQDRAWKSTPSDWLEHGKIADYGRGKQIFLSLKFMHMIDMQKVQEEYNKREQQRAIINAGK